NNDLLKCLKIFAKITIVTKIDAVPLKTFHCGRQGHASERHFEHFLNVTQGKPVARDLIAIDVELDVVAAHHALGEHAGRTWNLTNNSFNFSSDPLELCKVGSGDFDSDGSFDSSGEHVGSRGNRRRPG